MLRSFEQLVVPSLKNDKKKTNMYIERKLGYKKREVPK